MPHIFQIWWSPERMRFGKLEWILKSIYFKTYSQVILFRLLFSFCFFSRFLTWCQIFFLPHFRSLCLFFVVVLFFNPGLFFFVWKIISVIKPGVTLTHCVLHVAWGWVCVCVCGTGWVDRWMQWSTSECFLAGFLQRMKNNRWNITAFCCLRTKISVSAVRLFIMLSAEVVSCSCFKQCQPIFISMKKKKKMMMMVMLMNQWPLLPCSEERPGDSVALCTPCCLPVTPGTAGLPIFRALLAPFGKINGVGGRWMEEQEVDALLPSPPCHCGDTR